jgi:lipopolysaccharide transport system permease protein
MTSTFTPQTAAASPRRTSERVTHIRPSRGWFDLQLDEAWRYRGLLATLVQRDIQVLYKQALLGAAWAIIQPVLAVIIFTVVFGVLMKVPTPAGIPYPIFAFAAVLPWNYFAEGLRRGANGLVNEGEIVRKVFFPRMLIPLSGAIAPLLDFAIGLGVLLILMLAYGLAPSWHIVAVIPLALVAGLLALAVSLWLGPINVRYRDVKHTVPFLIQIWMYASPVVYPLDIVPEQWRWLYALNPMVGVIEGFRWAVTGQGVPDLTAMGVGLVLIVVLLLGGLAFFRKNEHSFADLI